MVGLEGQGNKISSKPTYRRRLESLVNKKVQALKVSEEHWRPKYLQWS